MITEIVYQNPSMINSNRQGIMLKTYSLFSHKYSGTYIRIHPRDKEKCPLNRVVSLIEVTCTKDYICVPLENVFP